mgnify:CR=1 FL=1
MEVQNVEWLRIRSPDQKFVRELMRRGYWVQSYEKWFHRSTPIVTVCKSGVNHGGLPFMIPLVNHDFSSIDYSAFIDVLDSIDRGHLPVSTDWRV